VPRRRQLDPVLLGATLLVACFGIVMVGSASAHLASQYYHLPETEFAVRQLVAVLLGVAGMLAATFVPLRIVTDWRVALPAILLTWLALLAAYGQGAVAGTHRWLHLPVGSFQPSALAKLTLPLALAALVARRRQRRADERITWAMAAATVAVTCGFVLFEPDLGSAGLLCAAGAAVLLLAGAPWRAMLVGGGAAGALGLVAILASAYRRQRLLSFLGAPSYQVQQSLIALGGGGLFGRGPGQSVQKLFFLPQPHSDFIFSIIGEELGFVGAIVTLVVLGVVAARGLAAARRAPSTASALLAAGIAVTLAIQTLFNASVCVDLLPAKGIPLPLVSAGGSDVAMTLVAVGLLLNVGKEAM
jgi:cell division protein FtsW